MIQIDNLMPSFVLQKHSKSVYCILYKKIINRHLLVSGSYDKSIIIWDLIIKDYIKIILLGTYTPIYINNLNSQNIIVSFDKNNGIGCINLNDYTIIYSKENKINSSNINKKRLYTIWKANVINLDTNIINNTTFKTDEEISCSISNIQLNINNFIYYVICAGNKNLMIIFKVDLNAKLITFYKDLNIKNINNEYITKANNINFFSIDNTNKNIYTVNNIGYIEYYSLY